ncbi:histidine kinase [Agromyces sp. NPDC049794]|uniref:sensor histidine kinase n=1 Tax=unclassified Agromyces TaxID=2639701 RepID=UPI0033FEB5D6
MQWALAILTVIAYVTLPLGSASFEQQPLPTLLVGLVYAVIAIFGFHVVQRRSVWWAVAFVAVQLPLGFVIFSLSGAAVGAVLLLVVLVSQSVMLLPLPVAAVVAAAIPLIHLGMQWRDGLREGLGTLAVTTFTLVVTELLVRERRARAELARANERLRDYAAQAEQLATIQERNRLARDIHDGVGHHLTVVQMVLEAARAVIRTADADRLDGMLAKAQEQSGQALAEVRRSVAALREQRPDLAEALGTLAAEASEAGVATELEVLGRARPVRAEVEESLYRAAQEGLTNVRKHADATRTTVVLDYREADRIRLEVRDDGHGLPEPAGAADAPEAAAAAETAAAGAAPTGGFGLTGLRERMASLGGRMSLAPAGETGLALTVEVPG